MITINPFSSFKEIKKLFRTLGKRALARIRTLEKYYGEGGEFEGRKNYVLDTFKDFNTKTAGLSEKAMRLKLEQAAEILNAKTSTISGVRSVDRKRYESFMKNHIDARELPELKKNGDPKKARKGGFKTKEITLADYIRAMKIFDKLKNAENNAKFGYEEQMYAAFQISTMGQIQYAGKKLTVEDFMNVMNNEADTGSISLPFSVHDWFSDLSPSVTAPFFQKVDEP